MKSQNDFTHNVERYDAKTRPDLFHNVSFQCLSFVLFPEVADALADGIEVGLLELASLEVGGVVGHALAALLGIGALA